jgi:hypothetical protein
MRPKVWQYCAKLAVAHTCMQTARLAVWVKLLLNGFKLLSNCQPRLSANLHRYRYTCKVYSLCTNITVERDSVCTKLVLPTQNQVGRKNAGCLRYTLHPKVDVHYTKPTWHGRNLSGLALRGTAKQDLDSMAVAVSGALLPSDEAYL